MEKKIVPLLILMMLLCTSTVFGAENILIENKECVLSIDLETDKLDGEKLAVYMIGEVIKEEESLSYKLTKEFEKADIDLQRMIVGSNSEKEQRAKDLFAFVKENREIESIRVIELDKDGKASITVAAGMYLICQFEENEFVEIQSVVAAVPEVNDSLDEWKYESTVKPKFVIHTDAPDTGDAKLLDEKIQIMAGMATVLSVFILTIVYIWRAKRVRK